VVARRQASSVTSDGYVRVWRQPSISAPAARAAEALSSFPDAWRVAGIYAAISNRKAKAEV
jgi:hypothetical protein